jgi:glycerol-3-phosphate dehydrogenase
MVIGGGITGLGVAWDACLRGIKVILIEQNDLGQGTSGRYHGLLHSGARYVLSDPQSAQECATENRILKEIAPHTIEDTGGLFLTTPSDPSGYANQWLPACQELGVSVEEISPLKALEFEPALNPRIQRAFRVDDAALDSFDLLHSLAEAIELLGGKILLRHRLEGLVLKANSIEAAEVRDLNSDQVVTIGAECFLNAAGPWSQHIAQLADVDLPIVLGKGTMIALASRMVHTVLNRCRPPSNGDIIVPIGTVSVIGTTDLKVDSPSDVHITPQEVDFLLAEGEILIPELRQQRPLRAWAGIRPLYRPSSKDAEATRSLTRGHIIINHAEHAGVENLLTIFGGKLTTFRLMAEQAVDLICAELSTDRTCQTATTHLEPKLDSFFQLPYRWEQVDQMNSSTPQEIICECELVNRSDLEKAITAAPSVDLDDIRRDLRLGMGPCQAGFCAYRAAGIAHQISPTAPPDSGLRNFLEERWRGLRPLAWGQSLRQMELTRRIYMDLLQSDRFVEPSP